MSRKPLAPETKKRMSKLLEYDFVIEVLNVHLGQIYQDFGEIKSIKLTPHKKHVGVTSTVFVIQYDVVYKTVEKTNKEVCVFVSAHSDNSRKYAFQKTKILYNNGFGEGKFRVTKPLFYLAPQRAFFYEASEGRNLFSFLREDKEANFAHIFELVAAWNKKLHNFDISHGKNTWHDFSIENMIPAPRTFIKDFLREDKILGRIIKELVEDMMGMEKKNFRKNKKALIYGDSHPENVIIESLRTQHLEMIDFTDLALGDPMMDLGTFLQQFDFMSHTFLPREKINKHKIKFVEAYFGKEFAKIKQDNINRINLYQSWTALRTTVFVFYMHNEESDILELLEESKKYLDLSKNSTRSINLH